MHCWQRCAITSGGFENVSVHRLSLIAKVELYIHSTPAIGYSFCCALAVGSHYPRSTSTSHPGSDLGRVRGLCLFLSFGLPSMSARSPKCGGNVRAVGFSFPRASGKNIPRLRTTFMYVPLLVFERLNCPTQQNII
jgi:hypothetical protein